MVGEVRARPECMWTYLSSFLSLGLYFESKAVDAVAAAAAVGAGQVDFVKVGTKQLHLQQLLYEAPIRSQKVA